MRQLSLLTREGQRGSSCVDSLWAILVFSSSRVLASHQTKLQGRGPAAEPMFTVTGRLSEFQEIGLVCVSGDEFAHTCNLKSLSFGICKPRRSPVPEPSGSPSKGTSRLGRFVGKFGAKFGRRQSACCCCRATNSDDVNTSMKERGGKGRLGDLPSKMTNVKPFEIVPLWHGQVRRPYK